MQIGKPIVTEKQITRQFKGKKTAERAIAVLKEKRVLPLSYNNPKLHLLNALGLYTFISGDIFFEEEANAYKAEITKTKNSVGIEKLVEKCEKELELGFRFGSRDGGRYHFSTNGSSYGRLLHAMGFYASTNEGRINGSRSGKDDATIPTYITQLIRNYDSLSGSGMKIARRLLRQYVFITYDTKANDDDSPYTSIRFRQQPTKEKQEKVMRTFITANNIVYPNVNLTMEDAEAKPTNGNEDHYGLITIPFEKAINYKMKNKSPLKFKVMVNPNFNF